MSVLIWSSRNSGTGEFEILCCSAWVDNVDDLSTHKLCAESGKSVATSKILVFHPQQLKYWLSKFFSVKVVHLTIAV